MPAVCEPPVFRPDRKPYDPPREHPPPGITPPRETQTGKGGNVRPKTLSPGAQGMWARHGKSV